MGGIINKFVQGAAQVGAQGMLEQYKDSILEKRELRLQALKDKAAKTEREFRVSEREAGETFKTSEREAGETFTETQNEDLNRGRSLDADRKEDILAIDRELANATDPERIEELNLRKEAYASPSYNRGNDGNWGAVTSMTEEYTDDYGEKQTRKSGKLMQTHQDGRSRIYKNGVWSEVSGADTTSKPKPRPKPKPKPDTGGPKTLQEARDGFKKSNPTATDAEIDAAVKKHFPKLS